MIIKTKYGHDIEIRKSGNFLSMIQDVDDDVCIDKEAAKQLIEVLRQWIENQGVGDE